MDRKVCCELTSRINSDVDLLFDFSHINKKDDDGNTPLHIACWYGHTKCVKFLVESGATLNEKNDDGATPIHYACGGCHTECVKFLIENGVHVSVKNNYDTTPLHYACEFGLLECVKILIESSTMSSTIINTKNKNGTTPLHEACRYGHMECVKFLIECGGDVGIGGYDITNKRNKFRTPFGLLKKEHQYEILKFIEDLSSLEIKEPSAED